MLGMSQPGMVIRFTARPEEAERFAAILSEAQPLVEPEPGTTPWMGVRSSEDPNTFFVVDLYGDPEAQERHVNGPAAALVLGEGRKLLAKDPDIVIVQLIAGKDV